MKYQDEQIRLNKFLANAGVASRRKSDELILQGLVKVNGKTVKDLGVKITLKDKVTVDGKQIHIKEKKTYILLNKPNDYITTTSDEKNRKTVLDLVNVSERVYPVGRLDRKTTGVLLLTNDGELANRLMHPKYQIEKEYKIVIDKPISDKQLKQLVKGINLDDGVAKATEVYLGKDDKEVYVTVHEGRNHLVRRMFESMGFEVLKLDRIRYAFLTKTGLKRGEWRTLKSSEVLTLKELVKIV
jgi:23S rRNA pseudouridine2605 synthase